MVGIRSLNINTTANIKVEMDASFYCLIGKKSDIDDVHTFFHMGFINGDGEAVPLLEVGKIGVGGARAKDGCLGPWPTISSALCRALFVQIGAIIRNEEHLLREKCSPDLSFDICYSAYQITRKQYLFFLGILKDIDHNQRKRFDFEIDKAIAKEAGLSSDKAKKYREDCFNLIFPAGRLKAFQPIKNSRYFEYRDIANWHKTPLSKCEKNNAYATQAKEGAQFLSFGNTCRHTGVEFLMAVLGERQSNFPPAVSTFFINQLPCFTAMKGGRYTHNLYFLPLPPSAYSLNKEQHRILSKVYLRMENLLLKNSEHDNTLPKFELIKELYEQLLDGRDAQINFLDAIALHAKQDGNQQIIDQHRGWHWPFFHETKTHDMFEAFQHEQALASKVFMDNKRSCL